MTEYPEHEKLKKISDKSQAIGEFVDWLRYEKNIQLAQWRNGTDMMPARALIRDLLAEFFDIDQDKIEEEKRAMLDEIRASHAKTEAPAEHPDPWAGVEGADDPELELGRKD